MYVNELEHQLRHSSIKKHILPIFETVVQLLVFDPKLLLFDLGWQALDILVWLWHCPLKDD